MPVDTDWQHDLLRPGSAKATESVPACRSATEPESGHPGDATDWAQEPEPGYPADETGRAHWAQETQPGHPPHATGWPQETEPGHPPHATGWAQETDSGPAWVCAPACWSARCQYSQCRGQTVPPGPHRRRRRR